MAPKRRTLEAVNQRLKQANIPVRVRQHGGTLSLRATLPPKPGKSGSAKQQEISLRIYSNPAGLQRAEAEALKLGSLMSLDKFDWNVYLNPREKANKTCRELIEEYKVFFFENHGKTPATEQRWQHFAQFVGIEVNLSDLEGMFEKSKFKWKPDLKDSELNVVA